MPNLIQIENVFIPLENIRQIIYYDAYKDVFAAQPNREPIIKIFFVNEKNPIIFEGQDAVRLNKFLTANSHKIS